MLIYTLVYQYLKLTVFGAVWKPSGYIFKNTDLVIKAFKPVNFARLGGFQVAEI